MSTLKGTSKKFGVLVLCGGIYPEKIGGSEVHVFYTCSRLAERGHRVFVISSAPTLSSKTSNENVPFVKVSLKLWPTPFATLSYLIKSFIVGFKLRKQIDIVHAHIADYPTVAAILFSLFSRKPCLVTCHGIRTRISGRKFLHRIFQLPFLYNVKGIFTVSGEIATLLIRKYGIPKRKIFVVGNGYDGGIIQELAKPQLKAEIKRLKRIICVANMRPEKDHVTLLKGFREIAAKYPDIELHIIGDGPLRSQLELFCSENNLSSKVIFEGVKSHEEAVRAIAESTIFVLTSVEEGLPTVLVEAMALGKPVIATTVGGIPEIVKDGVNGILIPPRSPEHVAKALERLLTNSVLRRKLGKAAAESVKDYTWSKTAEKYEKIYYKVLQELGKG